MTIKIRLNPTDLAKIKNLLKDKEKAFQNFMTERGLDVTGQRIVQEMKDQISAGISPIKQAGRFPGYKAATGINDTKKKLRGSKNSMLGASGASHANKLRKDISNLKTRYPYSVQDKFPNKQVRPVNLFLSGKLLEALKYKLIKGVSAKLEIGYYDKKSILMEQGHREGANGQPERPTIPAEGEEFNAKIMKVFLDQITVAVKRFLNSA